MARIYVATGFMNYRTAREWMNDLREAGHTITHDWTNTDEFDQYGLPMGGKLTREKNIEYGTADMEGVRQADVVVLLPYLSLYGALIEAGMAIALGKRVMVLQPTRDSVFWYLPAVEVYTDPDELRRVLEIKEKASV